MDAKSEVQRLSVVFIGTASSGKSTALIHLVFQLGALPQRAMDKYKAEAEQMGKPETCFSRIIDEYKLERERSMSIISKKKSVLINNKRLIFIDTPGHHSFIKNCIRGVIVADYPILFLSAQEEDFIISVSRHQKINILDRLVLLHAFGFRKIIVAVNKMDLVGYSQEKYESIVNQFNEVVAQVFASKYFDFDFAPISGWEGENLGHKNTKMPWYKGSTLIDLISNLKQPNREVNGPPRFLLQDRYRISGVGTVLIGKVLSGELKAGQGLSYTSINKYSMTLRTIEEFYKENDKALAGMIVGISISYSSRKDFKPGMVIYPFKDPKPPKLCREIVAQVMTLGSSTDINLEYTATIYIQMESLGCTLKEIMTRVDRDSFDGTECLSMFRPGELATVRLRFSRQICVERFADCPLLGRFVIMNGHDIIMIGIVLDVIQVEEEKKK